MNKLPFAPAVHVRFGEHSRQLNVAQLGLPANPSDHAVRSAVARNLAVPVFELAAHVVERSHNGNITVRPNAALN